MVDNHRASDWRPAASLKALHQRATLLARLRQYFAQAGVLEVETPVLAAAGATDPNIPSFNVQHPDGEKLPPLYLNTSPEFAMKRLLAAGSGPIYQVSKAFRRGEQGRWHNPEFTLLEWYRPGFDHHRLMDEVADLVACLAEGLAEKPAGLSGHERLTYAQCFQRWLHIDPHTASGQQLRECAHAQGLQGITGLSDTERDAWLDLLMSLCIQPKLKETFGQDCLVFVYDYPASQAALARIQPGPPAVAARFELFIDGIEIANGFHELQDAREQRARFEADAARREAERLPAITHDEHLLAALEAGLPDCAGVAVGLDRLLMVLGGWPNLGAVLTFPFERI